MKEAEKRFLTHSWESGYRCAEGFRLHGLCKVSVFVLPSAIAWHAPPNQLWSILVECVKLRWNKYCYSLAIVIVRQVRSYVNKGQVVWFGLAWLPAVWEITLILTDYFFKFIFTKIAIDPLMLKFVPAFTSRVAVVSQVSMYFLLSWFCLM